MSTPRGGEGPLDAKSFESFFLFTLNILYFVPAFIEIQLF